MLPTGILCLAKAAAVKRRLMPAPVLKLSGPHRRWKLISGPSLGTPSQRQVLGPLRPLFFGRSTQRPSVLETRMMRLMERSDGQRREGPGGRLHSSVAKTAMLSTGTPARLKAHGHGGPPAHSVRCLTDRHHRPAQARDFSPRRMTARVGQRAGAPRPLLWRLNPLLCIRTKILER